MEKFILTRSLNAVNIGYSYEGILGYVSPGLDGCGDDICSETEDYYSCNIDCNPDNVPYSFLQIHEEQLGLDKNVWGYLLEIMDLANDYNVLVSITFWPGDAQWVLDNQYAYKQVHDWQAQGHEIGIHTQGLYSYSSCKDDSNACWNDGDWDKYEALLNTEYQDTIKSGTVAGLIGEVTGTPEYLEQIGSTYLYQTNGRPDGRASKATELTLNGRTIYTLPIQAGYRMSQEKIDNYLSLESDEFFGYVFHTQDPFIFGPDVSLSLLEDWFEIMSRNDPDGIKRKTISSLMEDHILPNNLIIREVELPCPNFNGHPYTTDWNGYHMDFNFENFNSPNCIGSNEDRFFLERMDIVCGDGVCYEENIETCSEDCENPEYFEYVCGDGICNTPEHANCQQDCWFYYDFFPK